MTGRQIIRKAMYARNYTQAVLAEKTGYSGQSSVHHVLYSRNRLRLDIFLKVLEAMDFEVIVRSKTESGEEWKVGM